MVPSVSYTEEFVRRAHGDQRYGDWPYIDHLLSVAYGLRAHGELAYIAGLLHDVVEDTRVTIGHLEAMGYPSMVIGAVNSVTLREGEDYSDRLAAAAMHPLGCHVKMSDNAANRRALEKLSISDPARAERLQDKYDRAAPILRVALRGHYQKLEQPFGVPMVFGVEMETTGRAVQGVTFEMLFED